jgi:hypothetical protein
MRNRIIAAIGAAGFILASALSLSGPVAASVHPHAHGVPPGISSVHPNVFWSVCDFKAVSPNKCLTYHDNGEVLTNENFDGDQADQHFFFASTGTCGNGHVTSTCPFDVGSGNNTKFLGDAIYTLHAQSFSNQCGNGFGNGNAVIAGACSGVNGVNWVNDGTYAFVNVYSTNLSPSNTPGYLTGGNNHTAVIVHGGFVEGYSQYGGES